MLDCRHPAVIVHNAAHVRLVRETAARLKVAPMLLTPPGAAAYAGVRYLKVLVDRAPDCAALLDCGTEPGFAMAAMRAGWRDIHLAGEQVVLEKIEGMLNQIGGRLHRALPPALDLGSADLPEARLTDWLIA